MPLLYILYYIGALVVSEKAPSHHPDETEGVPIGLFLLVLYLLARLCRLAQPRTFVCLMKFPSFEHVLLDELLHVGGCLLCLAAVHDVADYLVGHGGMLHIHVRAGLPRYFI